MVRQRDVWEETGTFTDVGNVWVLLVTSQGDAFSWNVYMGFSQFWGLDVEFGDV